LVHGSTSMAALIGKAGNYLLGAIGYAVIPLLVYVLAVRPDRRALADALWPADANRRMLVVLLATMLFAPPLTAPLIGMQLSSLWTMSAWFLLPIVLLAPNTATLPRRRAVDVALAVTAFTAAALVAAPAVAWARHDKGERDGRAYYRLAGEQLAQAWRRTTVQPLRIVLGTFDLSVAMTFYHPDHPDSVPDFNLRMAPWITAERMAREGYAVICPSEGAVCITNLDERQKSNASARRMEIEVARGYLGRAGKSARFVLLLVAPQPATAGGSLSAGIVP
jgi:hypothetical protein